MARKISSQQSGAVYSLISSGPRPASQIKANTARSLVKLGYAISRWTDYGNRYRVTAEGIVALYRAEGYVPLIFDREVMADLHEAANLERCEREAICLTCYAAPAVDAGDCAVCGPQVTSLMLSGRAQRFAREIVRGRRAAPPRPVVDVAGREIKVGDRVEVIARARKGERGRVIAVMPARPQDAADDASISIHWDDPDANITAGTPGNFRVLSDDELDAEARAAHVRDQLDRADAAREAAQLLAAAADVVDEPPAAAVDPAAAAAAAALIAAAPLMNPDEVDRSIGRVRNPEKFVNFRHDEQAAIWAARGPVDGPAVLVILSMQDAVVGPFVDAAAARAWWGHDGNKLAGRPAIRCAILPAPAPAPVNEEDKPMSPNHNHMYYDRGDRPNDNVEACRYPANCPTTASVERQRAARAAAEAAAAAAAEPTPAEIGKALDDDQVSLLRWLAGGLPPSGPADRAAYRALEVRGLTERCELEPYHRPTAGGFAVLDALGVLVPWERRPYGDVGYGDRVELTRHEYGPSEALAAGRPVRVHFIDGSTDRKAWIVDDQAERGWWIPARYLRPRNPRPAVIARDEVEAHAEERRRTAAAAPVAVAGQPMPEITIERAKLYPVGRGNYRTSWKWTYNYRVDGGQLAQYGPGLTSLLSTLRRRHPGARIVKTWEGAR